MRFLNFSKENYLITQGRGMHVQIEIRWVHQRTTQCKKNWRANNVLTKMLHITNTRLAEFNLQLKALLLKILND